MLATVNCLERRLGVYVSRAQAEAIAERWADLGLHDVRIVDEDSIGRMLWRTRTEMTPDEVRDEKAAQREDMEERT